MRVNAVAYFRIVEPKAAIVQVENFMVATSQIAQTTLRSVLGQHLLDELLSERDKINAILQQIIDEATSPWGIKVSIVEVKDVEIPTGMQRAMARQAEAERERRAKVISAEGEFQASERLKDAAGGDGAGADGAAAPLPADAARDRRDEQLDDRLPAPDRPDPAASSAEGEQRATLGASRRADLPVGRRRGLRRSRIGRAKIPRSGGPLRLPRRRRVVVIASSRRCSAARPRPADRWPASRVAVGSSVASSQPSQARGSRPARPRAGASRSRPESRGPSA